MGNTDETLAELGVVFEVFSVIDHGRSQICYWQRLLFIVTFVPLRQGFDVGSHGLLKAFHTCRPLASRRENAGIVDSKDACVDL